MESFLTPYGLSNSGQEKLQFTVFGVVPSPYAQTAFAPELSKVITFCLRFYPVEISHSNSPNRELSKDFSDVVVRRRKVALHTGSSLTPTEASQSPDSTTSEGCRVSNEVRLGNCTQIWRWAKFEERGTHGWRKIVLHTCSDLSRPTHNTHARLVMSFLALSNGLILQSYVLSWRNCIL